MAATSVRASLATRIYQRGSGTSSIELNLSKSYGDRHSTVNDGTKTLLCTSQTDSAQ